jgi:hypothetical protein
MSYRSRILPFDEWPRLDATEAGPIRSQLDPLNTRVLVVEEDEQIVGVWVAIRVVHGECVWIAESHRHAVGVVSRLVRGMQRIAFDWGVRVVLTTATTDAVKGLCRKLGGVPVPGTGYALPMREN